MTIWTVCQARRGSSRLPDKVLMQACGKTLLEHQVERMLRAERLGQLVIATTQEPADDAIEELCQKRGWICYRGHSTDLLDRHYRAVVSLGAMPGDAVVKIPSDCPLIDPAVIDRVIGCYLESLSNGMSYDYVSNLHPATYPDGNDVEIFSFEVLETAWREARRPLEREHTTPFFWENPERFRIGNVRWETGLDYSMTHRWTLDYPEDYAFLKAVFEALYPRNPAFTLDDVLALAQAHPEIPAINQKYAGVNWYRHHLHELKTIRPEQTRGDCV